MMKELTALETLEVTERIQHAWLIGMSNTMAGDMPVFQGGTCLHLVHGSPRFSQDMDFMVTSVEGLNERITLAAERARAILEEANPGCLSKWEWRVSMRGAGEADLRNPRLYHLTVKAEGWVRSIKIKAEFFLVSRRQLERCTVKFVHTKSMAEPKTQVARSLQPRSTALVRALSINELVADKVYAAASREFIKARDWFDLWWIHRYVAEATLGAMVEWAESGWMNRCDMYSPGNTSASGTLRHHLIDRSLQLMSSGRERMTHVAEIKEWLLAHPDLQLQARQMVDDAVSLVHHLGKSLVSNEDAMRTRYATASANKAHAHASTPELMDMMVELA